MSIKFLMVKKIKTIKELRKIKNKLKSHNFLMVKIRQ